ncbi:GLUG motif-containing protein [Kineothrix alysoides]|uniref:GLUG motif-containing protein n=1 Tax=Kineothrix alysoides TaxID=1469948 RepID=A0A4R1QWW7_9FIRM|nr:S-layer homology domain-containing protein [Kineothrix alysoides]TCL54980.1 GLUG motif-containing protein [Kineothrix alysoides]
MNRVIKKVKKVAFLCMAVLLVLNTLPANVFAVEGESAGTDSGGGPVSAVGESLSADSGGGLTPLSGESPSADSNGEPAPAADGSSSADSSGEPAPAAGESASTDSSASPVLTIGVSAITDSGTTIEFTSDQDGTVYYLIQETAKNKPDADTLKVSESVKITAGLPAVIDTRNLMRNTAYTVYGIAVIEGRPEDNIVSENFTTDMGEQATPVVSLLAAQLTSDGAELIFESDQDGTYYCLIDEEQADAPDAQTVKAPDEAAVKENGAILAESAITVSVTGELDAQKQYTAYLTVENEKGMLSEVQSLPVTAPMMLRGIMAAGTPDTSWYNTSASTFEISTADQLAGLALLLTNADSSGVDNFSGKSIKLTNDIDLSAYQSGNGWVAIGNNPSFSGTFDGNGKTIRGLEISGAESGYSCGLFSSVVNGTVKNLRLEEISIQLSENHITGGIVANLASGTIGNCYVSGMISVSGGLRIGGITGYASGGTVKNCVSTVNVSGQSYIGGIAGALNTSVENCYATGNITAVASGSNRAGGIAGNMGSSAGIRGCAALNGTIMGSGANSGRIFGEKNSAAVSANNYASSTMLVNGSAVAGGSADDKDGVPKSGAEWLTAATWGSAVLNWDAAIWNISEGSLPSLQVFGAAAPSAIISITEHPASITNAIAGSISGMLSVVAEVTPSGSLSYQWYQNTTDSNSGGTAISGANSSSFTIPVTLSAGTYYYFCEVRAGTSSARSNAARVNVSAVADTTAPVPGAVGTLQVASNFFSPERILVSWTKATDSVSSQTGLKYYVYRSTANDISAVQDCENNGTLQNYGGTSDTDSYSATWPGAGTTYYFNVVVQDEAGNKAAYQPVLRNGIAFAKQPKATTLAAGYVSGSLSVAAVSAPEETLSYQWYHTVNDGYGSPDVLSGETNASFTLPASLAAGDHYYFCKVSIKGGSIWAYSDRAKITVLSEATVPTITGPTSMTLEEGYAATSTGMYTITGTEPIGVPVKAGNAKITWNDTTKKLDIAEGLTVGTYPVTLEASHPSGKKGTLNFTLTVNPSPVSSIAIKTSPAILTYKEGDILNLNGLVVTLMKSDGNTEDVALADFGAKGIITNPANGDTLSGGTSTVTITVNGKTVNQLITVKYLSPVPGKPILVEKTVSSVTLQTMTSGGTDARYRLGTEGTWQNSPSFTGLSPNTSYTFYAQYPETVTHAESPISEGLTVITNKAALSGTVTIAGTPKYGEELSVNTSALTSVPEIGASNLGVLSYQWKRSGTDITGANNALYTLDAADIGETITVAVTTANCEGTITSTGSGPVAKQQQAAPAAPALYNKTADTITLNPVLGMEYLEDGGTWQTSNTFDSLDPDTEYTFYMRLKGTTTKEPSPASLPFIVKTHKATLSGTVTVGGTPKYGALLLAGTTGLNTTPAIPDLGELSYQWKRNGGAIAGANSESYILSSGDIGKTITVAVTSANCEGNITSAATAVVEKADGSTAPVVTGSYTGNGSTFTYTINAITGAEYKLDSGIWQDNNVFTGIAPLSSHTFYVRVRETAIQKAGEAGDTGLISFARLNDRPVPALNYVVSEGDFPKTITITEVPGAEYSFNGSSFSSARTYTSNHSENVTLSIRLAETDTHSVSSTNSLSINTANKNQTAPDIFTLIYEGINDTSYTVTIPETAGAEYSFDGTSWSSTYTKTGCMPGETVTGYKRMAARPGYNASAAVSNSAALPVFRVKTPAASPNGGTFAGSQSITLFSQTEDAEIYYTTDGSMPTIGSTLYTASFRLVQTMTVKAIAVKTGMADSEVLSVTFTKQSGNEGSSGDDSSSGNSPSSGGNSSSDGSATKNTVTSSGKKPNQPVTASASVVTTAGVSGTASAAIPDKSVTDAIAKAQEEAKRQGKAANGISVELNVTIPRGATALSVMLTSSSLNSLVSAGVSSFEINGSFIRMNLDQKALTEVMKQSNGSISITIAPKTKFSSSSKAMAGTRPLYDITVSYPKDGKATAISTFNGGIVTIAIPYKPGKNEAVGCLYGVYMDATGKVTRIEGSAYDANAGAVLIPTGHLSVYGVGYTAPLQKFVDTGSHWAKDSIDYVAGRGLITGTFDMTFFPDTAMTRGMLVTALGRLAGVDTKLYATNTFTDVKADSDFHPYIEWAYKNGIIQGIGNQQFAPDRAITREEISLILQNYAKATGYTLPVTRDAVNYADASSIGSMYKTAVTAMQQAGIMMSGNGNKFNPKDHATRAEVSIMLHRYIKLTIDPSTAQGWALNDAGQWLYYKDGKPLTGTQTVDSVEYYFNADGIRGIGR